MNRLAQIEKEVDNLTDTTGEPLDHNIKYAVIAFRYAGFNTTASCEGHLDHGFPYPWIEMRYDNFKLRRIDKKRLKTLIKDFYKARESAHPLILQDFADFRLQSVKWPRLAKRIDDVDMADPILLIEYQKEMNDFADFLIHTADARHYKSLTDR